MSIDEAVLRKKISKAKLRLMMMRQTTFFSSLLSNMHLYINTTVPTACTNGISITFNPNFIKDMEDKDLLGLMMHELGHTIFDHINSCKELGLDPKIHNIAGDHYINLWLLSLGFSLPGSNYYADRKYVGWSTMKIYKDLMQNPPPNLDEFKMDIVQPPKDMRPEDRKEEINMILIKAVMQAQLANDYGSIPADLLLRLEDTINPRLPWNVILQNHMDAYNQQDFTWSIPNRRYWPEPYLPGVRSEGIEQMTVGVDVSGSMVKYVSEIFSEVSYIWETLQPQKMRLMTFDLQVHLNQVFTEGDAIKEIELKGGGGTNINPLLQTIREEAPAFALIFTDGYFPKPNMEGINSDLFWIISGNPKFQNPLGTIIHI